MDMADVAKPTVHMNGTGGEDLMSGYNEAYLKVGVAIDVVNKIEFNQRDYYVQPGAGWEQAVSQHRARLVKLQQVQAELGEIAMSIQDQLFARKGTR